MSTTAPFQPPLLRVVDGLAAAVSVIAGVAFPLPLLRAEPTVEVPPLLRRRRRRGKLDDAIKLTAALRRFDLD